MAKFPIQRAPEKLGVVPTTAVRADLDVRTGGRELAEAVAGFGGAIANLGLRWDLMQASTQLNEAKMFAEQEHTRLMLALPGLEPDEHVKEYEKSLKVQQSFMPTNRRAAGAYRQLLNNFAPQQELNVKDATKAKLKDNERAVGFISQRRAIESGDFADYFKHLEVGKKLGVYSAEEVAKYKQATIDGRVSYVKTTKATIKRQQAENLKLAQEETARQLLADIWEDKLKDKQDITDALRNNFITDTDAKYLRQQLLKTEPTELNLNNYAIVKEAITDIGTGAKTRTEAMSVLIANLDGIDETTGKSLVAEIFGKHDKVEAEMKREGRDIMEELIRDRDRFSGMFTDDERQILGTAEAILMYDSEMEKAAKAGKPLERRDQLIRAVQIARQIKTKIKFEESKKIKPEFRHIISEKPAKKGPLRSPKFEIDSKTEEPRKIFSEKGKEIGIKLQSGATFTIGNRAIFNGIEYEYIGNGEWKKIE
ncbi:MAG: hypothetical protein KAS32_25345 [Candidatus Peribacteraceae bacterium]|nr:hypothetical protein [Candidatus Peribacteraceae bacterium]